MSVPIQASDIDIVCVEVSPRGDARCRQWQNAAIGQTDAERLVAGLAAPEDDRPLPMDVVEGKVNVRERLLPGRRCPRRGVGGGARIRSIGLASVL